MPDFDSMFLLFILIGFFAQLVDGALGMAFGVISSTCMTVILGLPPATVSASIHTVEVFTTGASGLFHISYKNIDKKLFLRLVGPGVIGGVIGAYFLSGFPGDKIKPFIVAYLAIMGVMIIVRALRRRKLRAVAEGASHAGPYVAPIGLFGGFLDAVGGGGWGPIVTTNLIVRGESPRHVIGTVNLAEFFVTSAVSATFMFAGGLAFHKMTLGLLIGGVVAAPLAAYLVRFIPEKRLMLLVGGLIVATSLYQLWTLLT